MDFQSLFSLLQYYKQDQKVFDSSFLDIVTASDYLFKDEVEISVFLDFVEMLREQGVNELDLHNFTYYFIFGYKIPNLGKEFDMIRFGSNFNINIELKSSATQTKQLDQLKNNAFYLNFLDSETYYFTFSSDSRELFMYKPKQEELMRISGYQFLEYVSSQKIIRYRRDEVDQLFDVKNYLVSPFNDTQKFLDNRYLLTSHQQNIVKDIAEKTDASIFAISGSPGTGKSLLIYHIAKILLHKKKKVVIIHGANLNKGHEYLNKVGFDIKPIKELLTILPIADKYDYVIIDEAQRLLQTTSKPQLTGLVKTIRDTRAKFIISLDGKQLLSPDENKSNAELLIDVIKTLGGREYRLNNKFRTNPEISLFIKQLFKIPLGEKLSPVENRNLNIRLKYFSDREIANSYLRYKDSKEEWTLLNYTKSNRKREGLDEMCDDGIVSHKVIGQEFDNIIVPLDDNFYYEKDKSNKYMILKTTKSYYPLDKMLYQNLTRTRDVLEIVIINNQSLFIEISRILKKY